MYLSCNAIAPGFFRTDMTDALGDDMQEKILEKIPLNDMGEANEIASLALYLAGPEARYITGQVIAIDGGMTM